MSEISRDVFTKELGSVVELLQEWLEELENPKLWKRASDGEYIAIRADLPAPGHSVNQVSSIPVGQLRAELMLCSQKLEALASL